MKPLKEYGKSVSLQELCSYALKQPENRSAEWAVNKAYDWIFLTMQENDSECVITKDTMQEWSSKHNAVFNEFGEMQSYENDGRLIRCRAISDSIHEISVQCNYMTNRNKLYDINDLCQHIHSDKLENSVVLCLDSAAAYLGTSTLFKLKQLQVYTGLKQEELPPYLCKIDTDFSGKEVIKYAGLRCTTEVQTLLDLLDCVDYVGHQWLYEALSFYYMRHGENFDELIELMNSRQKEHFDMYKYDAIHYYDNEE